MTIPIHQDYLHCPKCENIMLLRSDSHNPLPSGTVAGTATPAVNSTGTFNTSQIWYEYYCPICGETITSFVLYKQPN
mgnify:CR=1 FL=1